MKFKVGDRVKDKGGLVEEIIEIDSRGYIRGRYATGMESNNYMSPDYYKLLNEPPTFKKGDRVSRSEGEYEGDLATIIGTKKEKFLVKYDKDDDEKNINGYHGKDFNLIKEATMDLRARIEAVTGWDKEADDIRANICAADYGIRLYHYATHLGGFCIFDTMKNNIQQDGNTKASIKFEFNTQCSKLQAFKKALLWLAEKAGKLEDKTKIKEEIAELKHRLEKLEDRL